MIPTEISFEPQQEHVRRSGPVMGDIITPWGAADWFESFSQDVTFYSTPSHGGFRVSGEAFKRIPDAVKRVLRHSPMNYSMGFGWFEEDCDASVVIKYLPDLFPEPEHHEYANKVFAQWIEPKLQEANNG